MTSIYLAGSMSNVERPNVWRRRVERNYPNFTYYNPCDFEVAGMTPNELVKTDIDYIKKSDILLARIWDEYTAGTVMEIQFAHNIGVKTIVMINFEPSPWILAHSDICILGSSINYCIECAMLSLIS